MSPGSLTPLEFTSETVAVLVASIDGFGEIITTVGSSSVLPSTSLPLSLVSDTLLLCPGLLAIAKALLITLGVLAVCADITYKAV